MERDGEDPAAIAVLQFILQQTPPPPGCLDVPRLLKILRENLPKRPLVLPPPPKVEVEWDYPPGHPLRDESDEAERKRRQPPPKPPLSEVEKFLEIELLHTGLDEGVEFTVQLENVRSDHKERQPSLGHHTSQIVHVVADADEKRHLQDIHAY